MIERGRITDALRFWEISRIPYNVVIAAVIAAKLAPFFDRYGGTDIASRIGLFPEMLWLAIVANIAFCAVYPVDVFLGLRRPIIWAVVTAVGAVLAWLVTGSLISGAIM